MKKIRKDHKWWLLNVENSIFYRVPLDSVGVSSKRLDILFDMRLVQYGDLTKGDPTYVLSEEGKKVLYDFKQWIEKEKMLHSEQSVQECDATTAKSR